MQLGHALLALLLTVGLLAACNNEIVVSAEPGTGASPEVRRLVAEIDAMLVVPQDEYEDGNAISAMFEALHYAVAEQKRTPRADRVVERMGTLVATGRGIGWDPQEAQVESLAREWSELRPEVLAGP